MARGGQRHGGARSSGSTTDGLGPRLGIEGPAVLSDRTCRTRGDRPRGDDLPDMERRATAWNCIAGCHCGGVVLVEGWLDVLERALSETNPSTLDLSPQRTLSPPGFDGGRPGGGHCKHSSILGVTVHGGLTRELSVPASRCTRRSLPRAVRSG